MLCRMPAVSLPDDLTEQLNDSESDHIYNTQRHGVAAYFSSDGRASADVHIGLKLDGVRRYRDISSVDPTINFQFQQNPDVSCKQDDIDFDPHKDKLLTIKVNRICFAMNIMRVM